MRQVNLCNVAGDDGFGADADARQEHFHLLRRRVLCFVKDDEGMVERASAHVGKRSDFDGIALE